MKSEIIEENTSREEIPGNLYYDADEPGTIYIYTEECQYVVLLSNEYILGGVSEDFQLGKPTLWSGTLKLTQ